jgi:hypothetical protein
MNTPPNGGPQSPDAQKTYHDDKIVAILTLRDPGAPPVSKASRVILGGPLYDLAGLQAKLQSGELDLGNDDHCYVATDTCWDDLGQLRWTTGNQVTKLLLLLRPRTPSSKGDYYKSEWCTESGGRLSPCDVYRVRVDEFNEWKRTVTAPLIYLKFCVEETGQVYLLLISCHLDRP